MPEQDFGRDLDFLRRHTDVVLLRGKSGDAQVAVVPAWQCRVMTSTAAGARGASFGWVNRELIASKKLQAHINVFGGEDRLWIGPEGGQFSIFTTPGKPFELKNWFTPPPLDTEPFSVIAKNAGRVHCRHQFQVTNWSGTKFRLQADREVRLLDPAQALKKLRVKLPRGLKCVAFESVNTLKNTGARAWSKRTGLLSIWMLGMFNASPGATAVVPFVRGPESKLGPIVNDSYFGKISANRLAIRDGVIFLRGDARSRGKIGLSPARARPLLGSYDAGTRTLTIVHYTLPRGVKEYVNSMWEIQKQPFSGDVVNSYNDGPPVPGAKQLGKFFELESSSPALALKPGKSAMHRHATVHLQGSGQQLNRIALAVFGVSLNAIKNAFKSKPG